VGEEGKVKSGLEEVRRCEKKEKLCANKKVIWGEGSQGLLSLIKVC